MIAVFKMMSGITNTEMTCDEETFDEEMALGSDGEEALAPDYNETIPTDHLKVHVNLEPYIDCFGRLFYEPV